MFGRNLPSMGGCAPLAANVFHVLANMALIQDWGVSSSINPPAWSVSVEMAAYVAFPALLVVAWSRAWPIALAAALVGLFLQPGFPEPARAYTRCFGGFLEGLLCFRAYVAIAPHLSAARVWWQPWLEAVTALAILAVIAASSQPDLSVFLFPPLILLLAFERGWLGRILKLGPLHYLGELSYALYLVHWGVIWIVHHSGVGGEVAGAAIAIVASILLSMASYHFLERPARSIVRRLISGGNAPARVAGLSTSR
jgi:peptidoglycan/LPS O-acetylase OafA/YrhL